MMFRYYWFGLLLCLFGQACSFTQKVQTGMQAYEVKQYSIATQLFEEEYNASRSLQDKAKIAFFAGESFIKINDPSTAASWYFKAHKDGFGAEALNKYAGALKQQEKYEEALAAYEDLLKTSPGNALYRSNITLCRQAMEWSRITNPAYEITLAPFNSAAADYAPQPIGPGTVLFSSDRDFKQTTDRYLWTGRAFSDIYISNTAGQVTSFDPKINSPENEGAAIISPDGRILLLTRCFSDNTYDAWCKLMISYRRSNWWSDPETLPFIRDKVNYGHPAFAFNGSTIFFSSDAPEGQGGHDLYYSQSDGEGGWSQPINLGSLINTAGQEQYPTIYKDTLYYSSDMLPGLGGLDIFKTYLDQNNNWVPPINMRTPVNSGGDDFGFVVDTFTPRTDDILMQGYFTSSRTGISRNDDIYSFKIKGIKPSDPIVLKPEGEDQEVKPIDHLLYISLRVVEPEFEIKGDPNSKRIGQRALPNGPVILTEGFTDQRFTSDAQGYVLFKLEWDRPYSFTARYRDHLAASYSLHTGEIDKKDLKPITTLNHILELDPIFKNMEIVLENIFYDYDQWFIRDDAKPSLNELSAILKTNPAIRIQLSSHTDCRGTEEYNLDLSQKRAQAAVEYLMSQGIPARRLVAQGFGESIPAVKCICETCTEEDHQKNRRTTFTIID